MNSFMTAVCRQSLAIDWTAVAAIVAIVAIILEYWYRRKRRLAEGAALAQFIQAEVDDISNSISMLYSRLGLHNEGTADAMANQIADNTSDEWVRWGLRLDWPVLRESAPRFHSLDENQVKIVTSLIYKLTGIKRMVEYILKSEDRHERYEYAKDLQKEVKEARAMVRSARLTPEAKARYREFQARQKSKS